MEIACGARLERVACFLKSYTHRECIRHQNEALALETQNDLSTMTQVRIDTIDSAPWSRDRARRKGEGRSDG